MNITEIRSKCHLAKTQSNQSPKSQTHKKSDPMSRIQYISSTWEKVSVRIPKIRESECPEQRKAQRQRAENPDADIVPKAMRFGTA